MIDIQGVHFQMLCFFEYNLDSGPISVCTVLADRSLTDMMAEFRKMTIFQVKKHNI